jgi:hypothetical protein
VFDSGAVNSSLSANLEVNSITVTDGYSGTMTFAGFGVTINDGSAVFDGTRSLAFGTYMKMIGADATFHVGAGVGTVSAALCSVHFSGGGSVTMDTDKNVTYDSLHIENANVDLSLIGVARAFFTSSTNFKKSAPGAILDCDSSLTLYGSYFQFESGSAGEYTVGSFSFTGTSPTYCTITSGTANGCIISLGSIDLDNSYIRFLSSVNLTINMGDFSGTAIKLGTTSGKTLTVNHSGTSVIAGYDQSTLNAGTIISNLGSSTIELSGNWVTDDTGSITPGTSTVVVTDTASITSHGEKFNRMVINAPGKTVTCVDDLTVNYIQVINGTLSGTVVVCRLPEGASSTRLGVMIGVGM